MNERRRGFTYIELMVVSVMIAILASILFPVLGQAQGKARNIACQSNLQQIHVALQIYARDFNERFPPRDLVPLDEYLRDRQVFRCPGQSPLRTVGLDNGRMTNVSYSYYSGLGSDAIAGSRIAIMSDASFGFHQDMSNYLFVDGHVKSFRTSDYLGMPSEIPRLGVPYEGRK